MATAGGNGSGGPTYVDEADVLEDNDRDSGSGGSDTVRAASRTSAAPTPLSGKGGVSLPRVASAQHSDRSSSSQHASTSAPSPSGAAIEEQHRQAAAALPAIQSTPPTQTGSRKQSRMAGSAKGGSKGPLLSKRGPASPYQMRPEPQPAKARHDTLHVDPKFLQSASYRAVRGVGTVYDWKAQHDVNMQLTKQRKQEAQTAKVLAAARVQISLREQNEAVFQQWLRDKQQERKHEWYNQQQARHVSAVYRQFERDDGGPGQRQQRETGWLSNFGALAGRASTATPTHYARERPADGALAPAAVAPMQGEVFRL